MGDSQWRMFIAAHLPEQLAATLAEEQRALGGSAAPVRWVAPGSLHLTLMFLGDVRADLRDSLSSALAGATRGVGPLGVQVQGLGAFPNLRRPRVVWAGLSGQVEELAALQGRIVRAVRAVGPQGDDKPFKPHLTLGRVRDGVRPEQLSELSRAIERRTLPPLPWTIDAVLLMRSELLPQGPRYTVVAEAPLVSEA